MDGASTRSWSQCGSRRLVGTPTDASNTTPRAVYSSGTLRTGNCRFRLHQTEPMRCVILQPSYIPWRGYFDLIRDADVFVFYDDVQYDDEGWRNRNRIKSPSGPRWLTIPVKKHGVLARGAPILDIETADDSWGRSH